MTISVYFVYIYNYNEMDFTLKKLELFGKSTHKTKLNPNPRSASKTASNDLGVTSMILQCLVGTFSE